MTLFPTGSGEPEIVALRESPGPPKGPPDQNLRSRGRTINKALKVQRQARRYRSKYVGAMLRACAPSLNISVHIMDCHRLIFVVMVLVMSMIKDDLNNNK